VAYALLLQKQFPHEIFILFTKQSFSATKVLLLRKYPNLR
jgi:hypothetical protein